MLDGMKDSGRRVLDPLGRLCFEGQDVANYLFQVPDDATQWERLGRIVDAILVETAKTFMESPKVLLAPPQGVMGMIRSVRGLELLQDAISRGKGVVRWGRTWVTGRSADSTAPTITP